MIAKITLFCHGLSMISKLMTADVQGKKLNICQETKMIYDLCSGTKQIYLYLLYSV